MGISKKNKRKIIFRDREFYWWAIDEHDGYQGMLEVNIVTENRAFIVKYYAVQQQEANKYITVIGKEFLGLDKNDGKWQRFSCPDFIPTFKNQGISPKDIKNILEWCFNQDKVLIPVNYKGELI